MKDALLWTLLAVVVLVNSLMPFYYFRNRPKEPPEGWKKIEDEE